MENALVTAPVCPLMTAPSLQCERADEALYGWTLDVLESPLSGWYLVRTHYSYTGYAPAECLLLGRGNAARWAALPKLVVTCGLCDVLAAPMVESWRVETLTRGALVSPVGTPDGKGWQQVALPDGRESYTKRNYLDSYYEKTRFSQEAQLRSAIVASAKSYLGTHYRWGGKTPVGIDCSGLSFMSYFLNGITIFRDARIEPGFPVHPIPLDCAGPGDLLYFPGHIAIYLGEGRYLHSTARAGSDGVVYNSLNPTDPDYRRDLAESITAVGSIF